MKLFTSLTFVLFLSIGSYAQMGINIHKDTASKMLNSFKFKSFKQYEENTVKSLALSLNFKNATRYTLYYDTLNTKSLLYDNYRQEYFNIDPLCPYPDFGTAVVGGTVYTLINLFYKKK